MYNDRINVELLFLKIRYKVADRESERTKKNKQKPRINKTKSLLFTHLALCFSEGSGIR